MLIGFSQKTSKTLARIFCRHFRHCIVLFPADTVMGMTARGTYILIQIGTDGVRLIQVGTPEIRKLKSAGWTFLAIPSDTHVPQLKHHWARPGLLTCVGFAKRALGIKNPFIWTPDQLYRYLNK